jgi:hypothetical protein
MIKLAIILCVGLLSCSEGGNSLDNKNPTDTLSEPLMKPVIPPDEMKISFDAVYQKYLPATLIDYLQKEHPTWSMPNENMWYPQLYKKYKTGNSLANYITGDFDGNQYKDYALLISTDSGSLSVIAFLNDNHTYKTIKLTEVPREGNEKIDYVLTLYQPGKYSSSDPDPGPAHSEIVNFTHPAIGIGRFKELYDGGNDVFYWDKNELKSCLIDK